MTTLNENYAEVAYNQTLKSIEIKWKGFANIEQYKTALHAALKIIEETKCKRWISDMVNGQAVPKEAAEWLKTVFIPMAIGRGINKAGFLLESNIFRKMYSDSIKSAILTNGAELRYFDNRSDLENWIVK